MPRFFITGDCHGAYSKLGFSTFPEGRELTKEDCVIICGDFGFWDNSPEQEYWRNWLDSRPFSVLWVDGNHENYDLLYQLPVGEWNGGKVHFIRPTVIHLMRGQLFTIAGKRFFTFGGAKSHDIKDGILERDDPMLKKKVRRLEEIGARFRINHLSWWKEELPDEREMEEGIRNLEAGGWKTDYILTHCCSSALQDEVSFGKFGSDRLTDYFNEIRERCEYKHWFFGHYHNSSDWSEKETCLYHQIVELTEDGSEGSKGYKGCGLARRFRCREHVRFRTYGFHGQEELTGTIMHIDERGGGLYFGEQPTANIRTDDGWYHKNIPFQDIRKLREDAAADEDIAAVENAESSGK